MVICVAVPNGGMEVSMNKKILLEAEHLNKSFAHNGVQNHVLCDVNLTIYEGDFTVIMGRSGSGKSTLLYSLSGMDTITDGVIRYQGNDISKKKEKEMAQLRNEEFGFVFQQMNLVSNLSLYENVVVPGYIKGKAERKAVNQRGEELLKQVGITEQKKRLPTQTSGGEQQRACIARALINEPNLIFADEPTGALNTQTGKDVLDIFTDLNEKGQSILMVTHDVKAATRANRILYIQDGNIGAELVLEKYRRENQKEIESQISAWLLARGW